MASKKEKDKTVKDVLDAMYTRYRLNAGINEVKLKEAWERITGKLISNHTVSIKMINKTLYVEFDNAPLKNEMMYRRASLIEAINNELGSVVVEKIFIR